MTRSNNIFRNLDWWTIGLFLVLSLFGWANVYSADFSFEQSSIFSFAYRSGKQFVWILTGMLVGMVVLLLDDKLIQRSSYLLYGLLVLVLLATPILAHDTKGSLSWINLGPVSLQPAEFSKFIVALALARYMSAYDYRMRSWRDLVVPAAFILVPMAIEVLLQKETGSALVLASFILMFYREGMTGYVLLIGVIAVAFFLIVIKFGAVALPIGTGMVGMFVPMLILMLICLVFFFDARKTKLTTALVAGAIALLYGVALIVNIWWPVNFEYVSYGILAAEVITLAILSLYNRRREMLLVLLVAVAFAAYCKMCNYGFEHVLKDHQRGRIEVLLGLKDDPQGAGYNVRQSLITIGSGRMIGKGYLNGTQTKMKFVPEQYTDFIFCTIGEEWGFVGCSALLLVYMFFILRMIHIAERQKDMFSQIYAYCVVSVFIFHIFINVGMVIGIVPVIGIPLPFISYGGSQMWGFCLLLFTLLRFDAARANKLR